MSIRNVGNTTDICTVPSLTNRIHIYTKLREGLKLFTNLVVFKAFYNPLSSMISGCNL